MLQGTSFFVDFMLFVTGISFRCFKKSMNYSTDELKNKDDIKALKV